MGLFDFLFGNRKPTNVQVLLDQIWMTTDAKFTGLIKEAEERAKSESVAILLVAHFPDVLERLHLLANEWTSDVPLIAVLASNLNTDLAASLNVDETAVIDIIVGERHPLPSVDENLVTFANELPCRCRFSHHVSLEDPVINIFGGESIKNMLGSLGMSEHEAIESKMISRRIRMAQQKIEGKTSKRLDAETAAEWLEKNCPEL
ncbi:preprotein translocase subunit SecA [Planctomycetes bacterium CA13]|uniref:Preprotein translocase subunit SecA n=1 Tax=Novipirellula herctigrandis TaxID=2527986 RepID=A0A5C5YNM7_9BACT|nr:preprotein translocase subunit SecA [Planctomycetes bacterium CA13]